MTAPRIVEVVVEVYAEEKRSPRQYETETRGGGVTLRAALAPGDSIEGAIRQLWDQAEVELEKRGLTVVKRVAEAGPANHDERRGGLPAPLVTAPVTSPSPPPTAPAPADSVAAKASFRARHREIVANLGAAIAKRLLSKKEYADLLALIQRALGKDARIGDFERVPAPLLVEWADSQPEVSP